MLYLYFSVLSSRAVEVKVYLFDHSCTKTTRMKDFYEISDFTRSILSSLIILALTSSGNPLSNQFIFVFLFIIFIYSKKYLFIYEYLPRFSFLQLNELLSMRVLPFFVKYLKKGPKEFVCCIYSLLVSITIDIYICSRRIW